ncbi:MAG TPA: tRNA (adenosine(37)-N6)-threonylcarbamoyltransferase complex dimerization subunit type 1 TsaB [Stellaceae bacterium]|nr:tRNA (adenosine(37)-N6)-threonylcarbamoyltransferase complex dimerization subunit type 1 TsaB [Stellaceae bacterium]
MVSVLAFDTAGNGCSAAVLRDGKIRARRFAPMARGQSEQLLPMIETVLGEAGLAVTALDLIAVTVGPGAFTGLRIGIAAARGLALASGVPALGITSFAAVASQVPRQACAGRALVVALDSRRAELYLQAFDASGVPLGDGALVAPADLARRVPAGPLLLAGDAAPALAAALAARRPEIAPGSGIADAADVARLAASAWRPGLRPAPPRPLYLRAPDITAPRPGPAG